MSQNKKGQKEILSKVMRYIKRYTGLILLSIVLASLIVILNTGIQNCFLHEVLSRTFHSSVHPQLLLEIPLPIKCGINIF